VGGAYLKSATADADGGYAFSGLPDGTYFLATRNSLGYVDELHDGRPCPGGSCS